MDSQNAAPVAPSPAAIRDELEGLVRNDLLGPAGGPDEEIDEASVRGRYLVGKLAPSNQTVEPDVNDEPALSEEDQGLEDGKADTVTVSPDSMFPSSIGLSFTVAAETQALQVTARWGRYERVKSETLKTEKNNPKTVWKRIQIDETLDPIPLARDAVSLPISETQPEVLIQCQMRQTPQGPWHVSLFLVNGQKKLPGIAGDSRWLFQPELIVRAPDGAAIFHHRQPHRTSSTFDPARVAEDQAMRMLYHREVEYAVGHSVAVHAETDPDDITRAFVLSTTVMPTHEAPQQTPPTAQDIPELADLTLDMKALAEMADVSLFKTLSVLPQAYAAWISAQQSKLGNPESPLSEHDESARAALARCEAARERILAGIDLLQNNPTALQAFRFANRAMYLQRLHTLIAEARRTGQQHDINALDQPANRSWRTFQLAFILLNLPGATDFTHPERAYAPDAIADLLWFPTGGGKTEAYLGLTAYVLGLRRLQGVIEDRRGDQGIAVLMRYTLRLLTLQQFQRATALICACESIRREAVSHGDHCWGEIPFRIGLWVGYRTTPNTTEQSAEAVSMQRSEHYGGGMNTPAQLTNCPWCGVSIDPGKHITVETPSKGKGRTLLYCGDDMGRCEFSAALSPGEGLPVLVVDSEIYRHPPSLLIATVDKFAQMPWRGETQMLFGQVNGYCPRHGFVSPDMEHVGSHPAIKGSNYGPVKVIGHTPLRPPDLIIQDELHLIGGPLGTMVGLYETAIDHLCSWEVNGQRVRPKVIASTATIRQAQDQVHKLFMRRVAVFPPHGLDIGDNFFSIQRPTDDATPGRRYLGICAPGDRMKSVLIRVYITYLAAAQTLYEKYGAAADPWMTLVGYFGSLRELGGMRRLVDDDIRDRLGRRELATLRGLKPRYLNPPFVEELTSRKSAADIPRLLDWLEVQFDPVNEQARRQAVKEERRQLANSSQRKPLDVLLATNMISVGVDVRRLGFMVVSGQPKNTAEYIQATSRVGRAWPGLVCTIFNWARPRDLSHYERFEHYHATFYQHVEALSVTPFSSGALDRGLAGILVSLVRLMSETYNANDRAQQFDSSHPIVQSAVEAIMERAQHVEHDPQVITEIRRLLQRKVDVWLREAQVPGRQLGYRTRRDGTTVGLLRQAEQGRRNDFTALNSMRDVEPSVGLILGVRE